MTRPAAWYLVLAVSSILPVALAAGPKISVDTPEFDAGVIEEGPRTVVRHTFVLKNTGDKPLRITDVRPGCGCTVVDYDSVIAPGKSGTLKPEINLQGYSGSTSKSITVISNAENQPMLRLTVTASVAPIIDIVPPTVNLDKCEPKCSGVVSLKTKKDDLQIRTIRFISGHGGPASGWMNTLPHYVDFTLTKTGDSKGAGYTTYSLNLSSLPLDGGRTWGTFEAETNHPKRNKLELRGFIDEKR